MGHDALALVADAYQPPLDPSIAVCVPKLVREKFVQEHIRPSLTHLARAEIGVSRLTLALRMYKPAVERAGRSPRTHLVDVVSQRFRGFARTAAPAGAGPALLSYKPPNETSGPRWSQLRTALVRHLEHELAVFQGRKSRVGLVRATWTYDPTLAKRRKIPRKRFVGYVLGTCRDFVNDRLSWIPSGFRAFACRQAALGQRQQTTARPDDLDTVSAAEAEPGYATACPAPEPEDPDAASAAERPSGLDSGVWQAVLRLDPGDRLAIDIVYYRGLSQWEGAMLVGEKYGTFRQRVNRAREQLRTDLREVLDPIEWTLRHLLQGLTIESIAHAAGVSPNQMKAFVSRTRIQLGEIVFRSLSNRGKDRGWLAPILKSRAAMAVLLMPPAPNVDPRKQVLEKRPVEFERQLQVAYEGVSRIRLRRLLANLPLVDSQVAVPSSIAPDSEQIAVLHLVEGTPLSRLIEVYPTHRDAILKAVTEHLLRPQLRLLVSAFLLTRDASVVADRFRRNMEWVKGAVEKAKYLLNGASDPEAAAVRKELTLGEAANRKNLEKLSTIVQQCMRLSLFVDEVFPVPAATTHPTGGAP